VIGVLAVPGSGAAAVPQRPCDSRAEQASGPVRPFVAAGDLRIGPVAFFGLKRLANPRDFALTGEAVDGRVFVKTPVKVRARRVVTISIARSDRAGAGLTFADDAPLRTGVPAVRFTACREDERAFAYDGAVGPLTVFAGGFSVAGARCVTLSVRVRGRRAPYVREVPFGVRRC
jgi:hypothetical protein